MGQIFDRAFRVAKSYMNDDSGNFQYENLSNDDELKKIIDGLNKDNNKQKEQTKNQNQNTANDSEINSLDKAYQLLQVNANSTVDEIKSAYKQRIKEYHPDRLETFGEELKKLAQTKTQEINKAYNLIRQARGF
jgi:DnaJ-domain-containing protein 1